MPGYSPRPPPRCGSGRVSSPQSLLPGSGTCPHSPQPADRLPAAGCASWPRSPFFWAPPDLSSLQVLVGDNHCLCCNTLVHRIPGVGPATHTLSRFGFPPGGGRGFELQRRSGAPVRDNTPRMTCSATRERLLHAAPSSSKAGAQSPSGVRAVAAPLQLIPLRRGFPETPVPSLIQLRVSNYWLLYGKPADLPSAHKTAQRVAIREVAQ